MAVTSSLSIRDRAPRAVKPRRARRWLLVVLLLVGLAGCAAVSDTLGALSSDGFSSPNVSVNGDQTGTTVTVLAAHHATLADDAAVGRAAELIWRTTPVRLDRVQAQVGQSSGEYDRTQLTSMFGSRDPALDAHSVGSAVATTLLWVGLIIVLVLVVVAVVVVLLVRRSRRRRAQSLSGPAWQAPYGQAPYGQAPYYQQQYGQQQYEQPAPQQPPQAPPSGSGPGPTAPR